MRAWWQSLLGAISLIAGVGILAPAEAQSQYFRRPVSSVNPNIMQIDEQAHLGEKISPAARLIDHTGRAFTWGDLLGKPVILVLSYYTCDGSCSIINQALADLLKDVKAVRPGEDFRILTLSFDRHDSLATTGAFRKQMTLTKAQREAWTFGTFADEAELKAETERIGFKFFWSPEDRIFLHPGAFLFFSPEGRLIRVLYHQEVEGRDVELAVLDAKQGQFRPSEIINLALSLCYSYNYADGKYRLSIPIIVGFGALLIGPTILGGSILGYRMKRRKLLVADGNHEEMA